MDKLQSLAEYLGVVDPAPSSVASSFSSTTIDVLVDVTDPVKFCQKIVESREFRQYVVNGITLGDIAPAIMGRILDHAWGKPVERVEVRDTTHRLEDLTAEQLEARAMRLAEMARSVRLAPLSVEDDVGRKTIH